MTTSEREVVAALGEAVTRRIGEPRYNLWFHRHTRLHWDAGVLTVGVPNRHFEEWLQKTFIRAVRDAATEVFGEPMEVRFTIDPELFRAVHLAVPFVDVLNDMLDASLPLTSGEWIEWGNPGKDKDAFDYMKSYSPYDNLEKRAYPAMLVTTSLPPPTLASNSRASFRLVTQSSMTTTTGRKFAGKSSRSIAPAPWLRYHHCQLL